MCIKLKTKPEIPDTSKLLTFLIGMIKRIETKYFELVIVNEYSYTHLSKQFRLRILMIRRCREANEGAFTIGMQNTSKQVPYFFVYIENHSRQLMTWIWVILLPHVIYSF